jgi:hypothetical protein
MGPVVPGQVETAGAMSIGAVMKDDVVLLLLDRRSCDVIVVNCGVLDDR